MVLTVTVWDQFGQPIGDLYQGAEVSENFGSFGRASINQFLTASSTYSDPVGVLVDGTIVSAGSAAALAWPSQPVIQLTQTLSPPPMNIDVFVDGFPLSPGVVNRTVTATPPGTVTITWP